MIHSKLRSHILALAEAFGAHAGLSVASVFANHIGDPKAAYRLIEGEDFKAKTLDRWVQLLSNAWPADLPWPEGSFERPEPLTKAEMEARDAVERNERTARAAARRPAKEEAGAE
ncbi:MAG: hypothetical protein DI527_00370 [Chelatococcus sp.]|nr:MAG: hypothetical protein DI527_00370 [Chelatococcus sp.]